MKHEKNRLDKNWEFTFDANLDAYSSYGISKYSGASGVAAHYYQNNNWDKIDLPHDWAVTLERHPGANTNSGAYPTSTFHRYAPEAHSDLDKVYNIGWYRKQFEFDKDWKGKRVFLEFEGVFRNSSYWVNGVYIDTHFSGYTSFTFEITDHILPDCTNSIAVRVDAELPEGWFYEGAGIYRHVNLLICEPVYFKHNETFVKAAIDGTINISAALVNDTADNISQSVTFEIYDAKEKCIAKSESNVSAEAFNEKEITAALKVENPSLWHVDSPNLYTLVIRAGKEETREFFGFRSIKMDPDKGLFLNGKPLKIRGACVHQDFGGVGSALSDNLNRYKIQKLKEMGVNAYRCSHNAPSPALLRACDELGMLVMDETRMFGKRPRLSASSQASLNATEIIRAYLCGA